MLNADRAIVLEPCPNCGEHGLERLGSYSHCVSCNFFEDYVRVIHWDLPLLKILNGCGG